MRRVRSSFHQKRRKQKRSVKGLLQSARPIIKKLFSVTISLKKLGRKKHPPKRYLRQDVHKKNYKNPFRSNKSDRWLLFRLLKQHRTIFAETTLGIILLIWFIVVFVTPTFYIQKIKVNGLQEIKQEDILAIIDEHLNTRAFFLIKRSHRLFLDTNSLREKIGYQYGLEEIEFNPHWPSHSILITIKEKDAVLAYSSQDRYFTIDRQGRVIRELADSSELSSETPLIYQYGSSEAPSIDSHVLTAGTIEVVRILAEELKKYPDFQVHSYRLRPSEQREITIQLNRQDDEEDLEEKASLEESLDQAVDLIARAETLDEKIERLQSALSDVSAEQLEPGQIEELLTQERTYSPTEGYQLNELEVYMQQGWSIRFGHEVLKDPKTVNKYLDIFATLNSTIEIGEVREYVDLRFKNKIYYR